MVRRIYPVTLSDKKSFWKRWEFWGVIGFVFLLHIIMFRGVLFAAPEITANNASIVRDELIPFFSFDKGFMPQATSFLTGSDEFRVTYSFWTSWVRFNPILPYAIVLLSSVSALVTILAFYRLAHRIVPAHPRRVLYAAVLAGLTIHLVLLYAKVAHFYTLVFGFSLFALSMALLIEQLFFLRQVRWRYILAVVALVLFNPAIHYHVIFYLSTAVLFALQGGLVLATKQSFKHFLKRGLSFLLPVILLSIVPYLLYIRATTPTADDVFSQVPVDYWAIFYSSLGLPYLFSLDSPGHVDLLRYGKYIAPQARILMATVFIAVISIFFFKDWRALSLKGKLAIYSLCFTMILAIWMSLGYSSQHILSFHNMLGGIGSILVDQTNIVASMISKALGIFINVLRYPHRFEFVLFFAVGALFTISLAWWLTASARRGWSSKKTLLLVTAFVALPFVAMPAYRTTFLSGDFGGFLRPYTVPNDLKQIKTKLHQEYASRLFILPSMEGGREVKTSDGNYSFLDKYLIYYLEQPTMYTGWGAEASQKITAYMVYRAIAYNEPWWQDLLINSFGISHVLVPHDLGVRKEGAMYLPDIEPKIEKNVEAADRFEKVYAGRNYSLYRAKTQPDATHTLIDMSWDTLTKELNARRLQGGSYYFPVQLSQFKTESSPKKEVLTDNPERAYYRAMATKKNIAIPDGSLLPFSQELIASSNYTTNMLSLSTLYDPRNRYNHTGEVIPSLVNLQTSQFSGLTAKAREKLLLEPRIEKEGNYRLLVHAASRLATLEATLNDKKVQLKRLASDELPKKHIDFSYYSIDVNLKSGQQRLYIPSSKNGVLVEYAMALPSEGVPRDFTKDGQKVPGADIKKQLYRLTVREGMYE